MPGFAVGRGEETKVAIRKVGVTGSYCWSKEQGLVANTYVASLTRDECDLLFVMMRFIIRANVSKPHLVELLDEMSVCFLSVCTHLMP